MRARTVIGFSLSFLVSLIFLWLAFHRIDWASVRSTFTFQRTLPWTLLGITFYLSGHVIRGLRCRLLVRPEARLRRTTATNIVVVGYAVNNVLPLRLGELARAGMLSRETGLPITQSLTVTFAERLFDGLVLLLMLLGAGLMVPLEGWILPALQVAAAVLGAALAGLLLIIACPQALTHTLARLTGRLGGRAQAFTLRLFTHVLSGVATLRCGVPANLNGLSVSARLSRTDISPPSRCAAGFSRTAEEFLDSASTAQIVVFRDLR
jgi:uncharacterized protein (TIRG00374 family)